MKTIEQVLAAGNEFIIDEISCMQHASIIKKYIRPEERHPWENLPKHSQLVFKLAFISICHQFNWDFLQNAIFTAIFDKPKNIPNFLASVRSKDIQEWLQDYPKKERIRSKERAKILRNIGKVILSDFDGDTEKLYETLSKTPIKEGEFSKLLDSFEGYSSDPLRKKTNVLTHDLYREGILTFIDPENIEPAVDYHIMRLYLRTGRVVPAETPILTYLKGHPNPRPLLVKKLREKVSDAEKLVAHYANINVADLNYIEWQIGRNICLNASPMCTQENPDLSLLPIDVKNLCDCNCPYIKDCQAATLDESMIKLEEPQYISSYY